MINFRIGLEKCIFLGNKQFNERDVCIQNREMKVPLDIKDLEVYILFNHEATIGKSL